MKDLRFNTALPCRSSPKFSNSALCISIPNQNFVWCWNAACLPQPFKRPSFCHRNTVTWKITKFDTLSYVREYAASAPVTNNCNIIVYVQQTYDTTTLWTTEEKLCELWTRRRIVSCGMNGCMRRRRRRRKRKMLGYI